MGHSTIVQYALENFKQQDNQLLIGDKTISEWANQYGTPLYLYDFSMIKNQVALFREHMPEDIKLYYAVKANPNKEILRAMAQIVDGFDVASAGELKSVTEAGGKAGSISFAGPGKNLSEIQEAVDADIGSINVESERELEFISQEAAIKNKTPRVSIRINPDFELHGSGVRMGGGSKQFGIDEERLPGVLKNMSQLNVDFQGFHIYTGSQNLNADSIADVMEQSLELCFKLVGDQADSIQLINLGGGFGIPYFGKDKPLDIVRIGERMALLMKLFKPRFPNAAFVIELGRYLVGEAGMYITRVLYDKISRGKKFLISDGGMNHHLAASGNFGQVLRKNFPIVHGSKLFGGNIETVEIVGPLCTPLDLLGTKIELPQAQEGDLLVFLHSGAYGYSASPLLFLGHNPPKEVVSYD